MFPFYLEHHLKSVSSLPRPYSMDEAAAAAAAMPKLLLMNSDTPSSRSNSESYKRPSATNHRSDIHPGLGFNLGLGYLEQQELQEQPQFPDLDPEVFYRLKKKKRLEVTSSSSRRSSSSSNVSSASSSSPNSLAVMKPHQIKCLVCGDLTRAKKVFCNYGAISCDNCRCFFRRSAEALMGTAKDKCPRVSSSVF